MIIEQRWVVGKFLGCDVVVTDEYASGKHCEVARSSTGQYFVRDLGSTNGTHIRAVTTNAIGERRTVETRVGDWTPILPGQTLIVGRSEIPWMAEASP